MTRTILLASAAILAAGAAAAAGVYDDASLPTVTGAVAQYDLTPRGDVDGLILHDGTEILFPPHLGTALASIVRPGDTVTAHGLKARALPLFRAVSITDATSDKTVADDGFDLAPPPPPPGGPGGGPGGGPRGPHPHGGPPRPPGPTFARSGTVRAVLYGPAGDPNGVLLADGTMVHVPPPAFATEARLLVAGATVFASGPGVSNVLGTSIAAEALGTTKVDAKPLAFPPPPDRGPGHGGPGDQGPPPPPPG